MYLQYNQSKNIKNATGFSLLLTSLGLLLITSCKKFISIDPPKTQLVTATVFDSDATAKAAMTGIYSQMGANSAAFIRGGIQGFSFLGGLSADELQNYSTAAPHREFFNNAISPGNTYLLNNIWAENYKYIFTVNSILEGLADASALSTNVKQQIEGEAKFIRGFCFFYLTNLFGDIPLTLSSDYKINSALSRSSSTTVYDQIVIDLTVAESLLPADYSASSGERTRPNKFAATALLARVYLYRSEFAKAEQAANAVIANAGTYTLVSNPDSVFLKNSKEAIWQLLPLVATINTFDGYYFILTTTPTTAALSNALLNSFEPGDNRYQKWIKSISTSAGTFYYPFKYKVKMVTEISEYTMVIRLAEQFLIRAEARAELGNAAGSRSDLNVIRSRAGLANTAANDKVSLLSAIEHERQTELFTEFGHRWLDLKRYKHADAILGPLKAPNWQSTDILYPIPQSEITIDPNLVQNPGY